jgi:tRNA modification GTPase
VLALIEAGIDFVEEEDVRFISGEGLRRGIRAAIDTLDAWAAAAGRVFAARPHVALAGLPNAGKSTLFNALVGSNRVIVSPVVGTTRDVVSCEIDAAGSPVVLQDCAGVGDDLDGLEAAAHLAAQSAAQQADLVLWVHDAWAAWRDVETGVCETLHRDRTLLVRSKLDLAAGGAAELPSELFAAELGVSVSTGQGLAALREWIARRIDEPLAAGAATLDDGRAGRARAALGRALELAAEHAPPAELVSLELRVALDALSNEADALRPDAVLGRIFSQFCVGK